MFFLIRILSFLVRVLPEFVLRGICRGLGGILYALPSKRRIVLSNLAHVYPDLPAKEIRRLAWENCSLTIEMGLFALASPGFNPASIRKRLTFSPDFYKVYHEVAEASPMIVLLPHNYLNEMVMFAPEMLDLPPKKVAAIYRPIDNPKIDQWVKQTRERGGLKLLSRNKGLEPAIEHLRANGHLALLVDQSAGDSGILGRVADRTASLSPLPDLLVRKFPVQIAFAYIERTGFFRAVLHIARPPDRNREPSVLFAEWLTQRLRTEPAWRTNWLWMHRRWKTQRKPEKRLRLEMKRGTASNFSVGMEDRRRADRFFLRLPNWLGDIVMAVPVIRAIRKARPDVRLTLVYRPQFESLVHLLQIPADDHLPVDSRTAEGRKILKQRRNDFADTAILFTNSFRGDREMQVIRAEQRFGINRQGKPRPLLTDTWTLPDGLDEESIHQTNLWQQFLQHFGLLEEPDYRPVPGRPASVGARKIGFFCGSENSPEKRWPVENWVTLARELIARDEELEIELYGTEADRAITTTITQSVRDERLSDRAGRTRLDELGEAIRQCSLAVGNDSGGMHLANALGCPGVVLFGPTNPVRTQPIFEAPLSLVQSSDAAKTGNGTMANIDPEEVLREVESAICHPQRH